VVDDNDSWRHFLVTALQGRPELRVISEASDGLEAVRQVELLRPDLILLDIGLPVLNGIEAARQCQKVSPTSKILCVSENRSPDIAEQALTNGASGYVVKSNAAADLLPAVESVLEGKRFVSASLALHPPGAHQIKNNPYLQFRHSALITEFLMSVIEATGSDFGKLQLFDPQNGTLRIVAQCGFQNEFLSFFDTVSCEGDTSCSRAMARRDRVVIADVVTDPVFSAETRGVLLSANVGSIQSTPLIGPSGEYFGVVSTYYKARGGALPHTWQSVDDLTERFLASLVPDRQP